MPAYRDVGPRRARRRPTPAGGQTDNAIPAQPFLHFIVC
jgi:hypothetical protein